MILALEIKETAPRQYQFIAPLQRFRVTATQNTLHAMQKVGARLSRVASDTGFLPGRYIIDYGDRKVTDIQARPGQMELQLRQQGLIA
jgi:hypothetical protein